VKTNNGKSEFERIQEACEAERVRTSKLHPRFVKLIKQCLSEKIGDSDIELHIEDERISVIMSKTRCSSITVKVKNDNFFLKDPFSTVEIPFNDDNIFITYINRLIDRLLISDIIKEYKKNRIDKLPEKLNISIPNFNLDIITADKFTELFNKIANEDSNGERIYKIDINRNKPNEIIIEFDIDCGRRGKHFANLKFNNRGEVSTNFFDNPLDGGDVEGQLEEQFVKYFYS
jgi:hypothetical protein